MSWDPQNHENMLAKELPDLSKLSVYQQRWLAKRELRGYHVPNITEKQFLDRHFSVKIPLTLQSAKARDQTPPIQALMFGELERRVDVVLFRSHFCRSIWGARSAVTKGYVMVNGEKVQLVI
jgi:ribosomal protein S4